MNRTGQTLSKANAAFRMFLFVGLGVLLSAQAVWGQKTAGADLVSRALLKEAGLSRLWQIQLPIKTAAGEKPNRLFVMDRYLLILTSRNYLFCRNREDGSVRFEMQIAEKGLPVMNPLYIDGRIFFLVGSQLRILNPATGMMERKADLAEVGENRNACIAKNDTFFYVAGVDRRVHAFRVQENGDYIQLFTATADNDSVITSLVATNDRVFFSTLAGNIVAMKADAPVKIWQYNASGAITAPLVLDGGSIYVGGQDTKLYKLSAATGRLQWDMPFYAGDRILEAPMPGETTLYLQAGINGLYGISKETGTEIWYIPQGESVLCESEDRAYVYVRPGVLRVMKNTTGREVYSLNFSEVSYYAVNLEDARMYLADERGRVACIAVP